MKKKKITIFIVGLFFVCMSLPLFAEDSMETLFGGDGDSVEEGDTSEDGGTTFGCYLAPAWKATFIEGGTSYYDGFRAAMIFNNNIAIGLGGYGMSYKNRLENITGDQYAVNERLESGYGGLLIEYHIFPENLFHVELGCIIGGGGNHISDGEVENDEEYEGDGYFAVEPEAHIFLNVFEYGRIGIGGSYRYVKGITDYGIDDSDLRGFNVSAMAQFGWF